MLDRRLRIVTESPDRRRDPRCSQIRLVRLSQAWTVRCNLRRLLTAGVAEASFRASSSGRVGDHRLQRLEAVLFLSKEPLTTRKLSQYARLADATEARTLIRRLNELYDANGRSFRVERVAGGYQLLTRPQFATWVRRLDHVPHETRLSAPALETLSVVAYRQPVLRAEIEAIRGVNCGEILRQLMERDLVRIGGRSDELGRPYIYTTTKQFLLMFGLDNVDSLPRVELMNRAGSKVVESRHENEADCSRSSKAGKMKTTQKGEDLAMPMGTLSVLEREQNLVATLEAEHVVPPLTAFDEDDDDYDEFYEEDDCEDDEDDEELDDEVNEDFGDEEDLDKLDAEDDEEEDEEEDDDEEEEDDDDFEDDEPWEEVDDDDDDWDDDEDDWDDEDDEDDEEEEEEEEEDWE